MDERSLQEQYAARAVLRGKMEKMQKELLKYKADAAKHAVEQKTLTETTT
jgi:hypothetical protein